MDVFVVRHAKAGSRRRFDGDDTLRPLSSNGQVQAKALVELLVRSDATRILTSPYTRCIETVAPLAKKLGLEVELEAELPSVRYEDRKGRPKVVRYWQMRPVETPDRFVPNHEVDEIVWLSVPEAVGLLTYDHDRDIVTALRV